jgi:membrane-anchored protein YejM (alkaline phosphatase superfamily)
MVGSRKENLANGLMVHKSHDGWQAWKQQQQQQQQNYGRRVSAFFFWLYIAKKIFFKLKLKLLKSSAF